MVSYIINDCLVKNLHVISVKKYIHIYGNEETLHFSSDKTFSNIVKNIDLKGKKT